MATAKTAARRRTTLLIDRELYQRFKAVKETRDVRTIQMAIEQSMRLWIKTKPQGQQSQAGE